MTTHTHGEQGEADDLVAVLTRVANYALAEGIYCRADAKASPADQRLIERATTADSDAARLRALAELVKAYREAQQSWDAALGAYPAMPMDEVHEREFVADAARDALLLLCLRGAPTPTPPNDDKGGTTDGD